MWQQHEALLLFLKKTLEMLEDGQQRL